MKTYRKSPLWVSSVSFFSWLLMVANPDRTGVGAAVGPASKHVINSRGCVEIDSLCLSPADVSNYEAIRTLHTQLDDDRNGDIDISESVEFLKDELQYTKGFEKRQETFHRNNDRHISVADLWHIWKQSEVHNWTVEQTVAWLGETVELSMYAKNFYENAINGSILPSSVLGIITGHAIDPSERLAANNEHFINRVLGIKDPKHRSKITIKAMDAVLFGPPKGSHLKDLVLVTLLTLALLGCFKAYQRNREYQAQLSNMMKDMEKLRVAEENLQKLEKNSRNPLRRGSAFEDAEGNSPEYVTNEVVQQLRQELEEEREKCCRLQQEMEGVESEDRGGIWDPPIALQHWLQLTYERERLAFEKKHLGAREQFTQAKEMCEKLNKQRRSLMGMLSSVHGKMDNIDQSISKARTTMEEVTQELSERDNRWNNIEMLGGFNITKNAGLHTLELMLRPQVNGGRPHSIYSPSIDDFMGYDFDMEMNKEYSYYSSRYGDQAPASSSSCSSGSRESCNQSQFHGNHGYKAIPPNVSQGTTVHQLLSNQSALMYLTMGGTKTATPTIHEANSVSDVRPGGSSRKKSHLLTRDSGSSIGSESSTTASTARMRYSQSQNFSSGLTVCTSSVEEEVLPRSVSTSSLSASLRSSSQINKDDSSNDEIDHSPYISDSTSFSIGGSRLTLNSEGGQTITGSQACENMSASEPSLDNPKSSTSSSLRCKQITTNFEEGNSSDSSLNSSMPSPNSEQIKKKKWFSNNISSRLSLGKSKKKKEKELDKDKETCKQESVSSRALDKDKESSKQESISGKA